MICGLYFQILVTYSSTYVLVALSIDRYDAITNLTYRYEERLSTACRGRQSWHFVVDPSVFTATQKRCVIPRNMPSSKAYGGSIPRAGISGEVVSVHLVHCQCALSRIGLDLEHIYAGLVLNLTDLVVPRDTPLQEYILASLMR